MMTFSLVTININYSETEAVYAAAHGSAQNQAKWAALQKINTAEKINILLPVKEHVNPRKIIISLSKIYQFAVKSNPQ